MPKARVEAAISVVASLVSFMGQSFFSWLVRRHGGRPEPPSGPCRVRHYPFGKRALPFAGECLTAPAHLAPGSPARGNLRLCATARDPWSTAVFSGQHRSACGRHAVRSRREGCVRATPAHGLTAPTHGLQELPHSSRRLPAYRRIRLGAAQER